MASFMTIYIATVTAVIPNFFCSVEELGFCLTVMLNNCPGMLRQFWHLFQTFEYRTFFMTLLRAFCKLVFLVPELWKANIFLHLSGSGKALHFFCLKYCMFCADFVNTFKYFWMYTLCFQVIRTSSSGIFRVGYFL